MPPLAALLIGACENGDGGAYPSSPETASSSPSTAPSSDAVPQAPLALLAPAMASDPLVARIHAAGREEEPVPLDAIDRP